MASPNQWTWAWANSGKPGMLVHGVAKSWTQLSNWTTRAYYMLGVVGCARLWGCSGKQNKHSPYSYGAVFKFFFAFVACLPLSLLPHFFFPLFLPLSVSVCLPLSVYCCLSVFSFSPPVGFSCGIMLCEHDYDDFWNCMESSENRERENDGNRMKGQVFFLSFLLYNEEPIIRIPLLQRVTLT